MALKPLIELKQLGFSYPGQSTLFQGLDLQLFPGETLALLGDNGSGKSTLFELILGLQSCPSGQIELFGQPMKKERDFHPFRGRIGLLFQQPALQLFCPTVLDELCFGPLNLGVDRATARTRAEQLLEQFSIGSLADRPSYRLSGGQQRRVALAAVLAMEPEVLLLDEPSNDLDHKARTELFELLELLPQSKLIISHDALLIERLASRKLTLRQGKLYAEDEALV